MVFIFEARIETELIELTNFLQGAEFADPSCGNLAVGRIGQLAGVFAMLHYGIPILLTRTQKTFGNFFGNLEVKMRLNVENGIC